MKATHVRPARKGLAIPMPERGCAIMPAGGAPVDLGQRYYRQLVRETLTDDYRKLRRTMIERVMTRYETMPEAEADRILALLHRYAADAARDEARRAGHALPAPSRLQIAA